ncbi:MAG: glycosyltransferase family 39 protein [Anaerolineae bacterium]|nr:glycosyltransferase family 39 protein [Anaerolineae bacterium]
MMNPQRQKHSLCELLTLVFVILIGSSIRFHALGQDMRFHPDEALFATFARTAAVQGDWLLHGALDKPPLTLYISAAAMRLFGVTTLDDGVLTLEIHAGEFAARVPHVFASILLIACVYAIGKAVYRRQSSARYTAALLVSLSPMAIAFSATIFTDNFLLFFVTLSVWMACWKRWAWAGMWLMAGFWCKQQALLYVPIIVGICWIESNKNKQALINPIIRIIIPVFAGIIMLFLWDGLRGQATSLWDLAVANNQPGRLELIYELQTRIELWARYAGYLIGPGLITTVLGITVIGAFILAWWKQLEGNPKAFNILWIIFISVYVSVHLVAINLYDRYLLLILVPVILLSAHAIEILRVYARRIRNVQVIGWALIMGYMIVTLPTSWEAGDGKLIIGGDQGRHQGIDELGQFLDQQRLGAIIYDPWLSWELGYYIGTWSDKRRVYYPSPELMIRDAIVERDPAPRYFVVPNWENPEPWLSALSSASFSIREVYSEFSFLVYELVPN